MKQIVVGIQNTGRDCWRVTYGGRVLGDSRGYDKRGAIAQAQLFDGAVSSRWLGGEWVPTVCVVDPSLTPIKGE
jgi:hypothetical protein